MEEGKHELEFDEFEKLLCEIPNATSGNHHSEEPELKRNNLSAVSKIHNNGEGNVSPIKREDSDGQCLAAAFAELSYHDASNSNYSILMDGHFPGSLRKQIPNMNARLVSQEGSNQHCCRLFENLPLAQGMQGYRHLSGVPVAGVEFPMMSDQQYYMDPQSPLPYLPSQQLNQPQVSMHQQYLWLQQLLRLDGRSPVQENGNMLVSRKSRQPHFEMTLSQQLEQSNRDLLWTNYAFQRSLSQLSPALSSKSFNAVQVPDKAGRHGFPQKILTRSHGLNTLRTVKFSSIGGNESLNQNAKLLSYGRFRHSLPTSNVGCLQADATSPWGPSPDTPNLKSIDLKSPSQKYNSVDEVTGRILLLAKDQHGCRFLQRKFSEGTPKDLEKIFLEIIDHIVELMTDPFGNYLVQKLLEVCNADQQKQILHAVTREPGVLVRISCDIHGTRAVQKVIQTLKTPEQVSLVVSSLRPDIVPLMKNPNGNHVAQRCLLYLMPEYSEFLFEAASANCVELATDRHGCCVLQKCLSHSDGEHRRRLICEINANALILSQDPYGNYVVQFVFDLQLPWATEEILDQLEGNYGDLSVQKYSSNVVEKCLKSAGEELCARIIRELINNPRLDHIMQDPYGNYVIQAALNQSEGALQAALVDAIRPLVPVLRTSPYGKKVLSSNSMKK